jgi:hypothetical protein
VDIVDWKWVEWVWGLTRQFAGVFEGVFYEKRLSDKQVTRPHGFFRLACDWQLSAEWR